MKSEEEDHYRGVCWVTGSGVCAFNDKPKKFSLFANDSYVVLYAPPLTTHAIMNRIYSGKYNKNGKPENKQTINNHNEYSIPTLV